MLRRDDVMSVVDGCYADARPLQARIRAQDGAYDGGGRTSVI